MNFELYEVKQEDKSIIYNLLQIYIYELSFFEDETAIFTLLDNGLFETSNSVELYWVEEVRRAYILKCDGNLAGFVLKRVTKEGANEIAEFFVLNKYRNVGAGTFMANKMFELYKGKWEIDTLLKNKRAQSFWRKVVREASNSKFEEKLNDSKTRHIFCFEN